jgi:hypothetical protein
VFKEFKEYFASSVNVWWLFIAQEHLIKFSDDDFFLSVPWWPLWHFSKQL